MIDPFFTYTYANGFEILTICTLTGDVIEKHMIPASHDPFVIVIMDAIKTMRIDADLIAKKFMINKTPFVIQKRDGVFDVFVRTNQAIYDMFLCVADLLIYEIEDVGGCLKMFGETAVYETGD